MKRIQIVIVSLLLSAMPGFAIADGPIPVGPTSLQLATRIAAVGAQINAAQSNTALACAMLFSTSSVPVGQEVVLAWGSVGAVEQTIDALNNRPTNGATTMLFSKPGNWTYSFTFYDTTRASITCNAKILVTQ